MSNDNILLNNYDIISVNQQFAPASGNSSGWLCCSVASTAAMYVYNISIYMLHPEAVRLPPGSRGSSGPYTHSHSTKAVLVGRRSGGRCRGREEMPPEVQSNLRTSVVVRRQGCTGGKKHNKTHATWWVQNEKYTAHPPCFVGYERFVEQARWRGKSLWVAVDISTNILRTIQGEQNK